jgi:hypothetical protein
MISGSGTVYKRDLGAKTAELVEKIDAFDPKDWTVAE